MTSREHRVQGGVLREGGGGWAVWTPAGEARGQVRLRVTRDRQGRRVIAEVRLLDPLGVAAGLLRRVPVGALEDVLNGNANVVPKTVAAAARVQTPTVHAESASVTAEARIDAHGSEVEDATFYQGVASDYSAAAAVTRHPARKLAEDRGVSGRTVSRWLSEARRRGFLPPARRSRAR